MMRRPTGMAIALVLGCLLCASLGVMAIRNLIESEVESTQERSMADMLALSKALSSYRLDWDGYPAADSIEELGSILRPRYMADPPVRDGFGYRLRYQLSPGPSYCLRSAGSDGVWDHENARDYRYLETNDEAADIVIVDGVFLVAPAGLRRD